MKMLAGAFTAALLAGCTPPVPTPPVEKPVAEKPVAKPAPEPRPTAPPEPGKVTSIRIDQIFPLRLEEKVLLVDVRRSLFYQLGHVDGAVNLPLVDFEKAYPAIKPQLDAAAEAGKVIVTYCQNETCPDSRTTAEALALRGHDVSIYSGGLDEWRAVGVD
ncbi:rhodanese-like domain-containing protein [Haloferula sp. A504]|uniref:rhodanese-like domain-containing protein n=1 Tax=Haloferula sp. A504 TaxID=3373601 RepID=UPI0031CB7D32|nr:rhodanese-like domain-containing protein [Verrucomicrobiaceae bacterium E54]